jgi:hypothetical protein
MTNERFDQLTKTLSTTASRRSVFKGVVAAAVGGVFTRFRGDAAEARARVRMACARLGQPCAAGTGTPGAMLCCPQLTCGADAVCCKDTNATCVDDGDCCADNVCRPNPTGLGHRCLPAGDVGSECVEDSDCADGLGCHATALVCVSVCNDANCSPVEFCCGVPFAIGSTLCCGKPNTACDQSYPQCVGCAEYNEPCNSDSECCNNLRDGNAVCGLLPTDTNVGGTLTLLELSGFCCVPEGGSCAVGPCCNGTFCGIQEVCEPAIT